MPLGSGPARAYVETVDYAPVRLVAQTDVLGLTEDMTLCYRTAGVDVVADSGGDGPEHPLRLTEVVSRSTTE